MAVRARDTARGRTRAGIRLRRAWLAGSGLLLLGVAATLVPAWWRLVTHPVVVPATPADAAREARPGLLAHVGANPRSVDARMELVASEALLGDRLAAWQQLAIAERLVAAAEAVPGETTLDTIQVARARTAEALGHLDDAAGAAERAWQASPADLSRAREAFRLRTLRGDFARALAIARAFLARHPTDPTGLATAGEALFNLARYPEAIRLLQSARLTAPEDLTTAVQLGAALIRADRGREAMSILEEVTQISSPPPQAWEFLGQAQLSVGQTRAAGDSFRRAEAAGAAGAGAVFGTALVALAQGQTGAAEVALRRALVRDPEHDAAALTLAQLLRARGRPAEAAAVRGRQALAVGDTAEAVRRFQEAIRLAHDDRTLLATFWRELASALQAEEDGPGALDALRRARAFVPEDAELVRQQIETALALFSPQEALRACARYEALRPSESAQVAWWRFRAYRQMQDPPRAAEAMRAASAAQPDQPQLLTWRARTLLEQAPDAAQVAAAEGLLRRALAQRPVDLETLASLAEVLLRQRRWEEAGGYLRRALSLDERWRRGRLWLQLAQADRALGRSLEAAWDVERYRALEELRTELARRHVEANAHPRDAARLIAWAQAALQADRPAEARTVARAAIRIAPTDAGGYFALASACQRLARLEDRIVAMEAAAHMSRGDRRAE